MKLKIICKQHYNKNMDASFNEFNDDNYVRPPDTPKKERLLPDNRSDYEKQIDEAMYLSIQEFKNQENINKKYEKDIINEHVIITKERKGIFREFLLNLNKLIILDKELKEIYEIIEPIIDFYCAQHINHCELDSITYDRIFKIIGNIRTNTDSIELLKKI